MSKLIKGAGGGGKSGGSGRSVRVPVESPDNLRSRQYANVLDLISEGEIGGLVNGLKSIYLNDTPLQNEDGSFNFSGVSVVERSGTQFQSYIPGFSASESELSVNTEVTNALSITRTISNVNNTAARVTLSVPALTSQDTSTGDISGSSIQIAIDVQTNGGGFVPQALRREFSASSFSVIPGGAVSAVDSNRFIVNVGWSGEQLQQPQNCVMQLQYRIVGAADWSISQSFTFSGTYAIHRTPVETIVYPSGERTFDLALADGRYEFRVVKVSGSGSVAITGGSSYLPVYVDTILGKTTSRYQRSYRFDLQAGGPWDIRVRRLTADSTSSTLQNKTFFDSITEIVDQKLTYPNSALVGLNINAEQFDSIPVRGFDVYGMLVKHPSNYNPITREYSGTWDGTFTVGWTDNPAWVFYDAVTNSRYGLGDFLGDSLPDKWVLYTIAQYCDVMVEDGFGGTEPRFTCNLYLQSKEEAYKVIANLASVFRAITFWSGGEIVVSQDAPKDVEQLFAKANVIDGQFNYSGSSGSVRHSVALVSWNDPQDGYRQKIEYVSDDDAISRYGVIQTEIVAFGCASRGQAARIGRWLIYSEQNETETITFRAGMDSVYVSAGSIISTQDPSRAGTRMGGRIVSATLSSVTIDAPVTITSGVHTLSMVLPDKSIEERVIVNGIGQTSVLNVATDFSQLPQDYAMWILSSASLVSEQWRVVSIAEVEKTQFEITALSYRPDKYNAIEQDLKLEPLPLSIFNNGAPGTPVNLKVSESLYLIGLSAVAVSCTVSWDLVPFVTSYVLVYQKGNDNPVTIDNIHNNSIDIRPIAEGDYTFTVYAANSLGRRSQGSTLAVAIRGKTTPPKDLVNLHMVALSGYAYLTWSAAEDLDVLVGGYLRIRFTPDQISPSWIAASDIGPQVPGNATSATLPLLTGTYLAKWFDSTGNQSANATLISSNVASIVTLNVVETVTESPVFAGQKSGVVMDAQKNGIKLAAVDLISEWPLLSEVGYLSSQGGILSTGEYLFDGSVDLGSLQTSRLTANLQVLAFDANDLISKRDLISTWQNFGGQNISDVGAAIHVRTTNDNPLTAPVWSDWQPFYVGDWVARAYEFKAVLTSQNYLHNVVIKALEVVVDMPDREEFGENIVSGAASYTVTFSREFMMMPAVGITAQNIQTGDYYTISNKGTEGFDIQFFNSSNASISRTFDFHAKSY